MATGKHDAAPVPFDQTMPPLLRVVVALRPLEISTLLGKHVKWLRNGESEMSIRQEKEKEKAKQRKKEKEREKEKEGKKREEKVAKVEEDDRAKRENSTRARHENREGSRVGRPLTSARAAWLYALLARVDKPLSRKDASIMRSLGRYLSKRRATHITGASDPRLASINVILTLIEVGFGQCTQMDLFTGTLTYI